MNTNVDKPDLYSQEDFDRDVLQVIAILQRQYQTKEGGRRQIVSFKDGEILINECRPFKCKNIMITIGTEKDV